METSLSVLNQAKLTVCVLTIYSKRLFLFPFSCVELGEARLDKVSSLWMIVNWHF